GLFVVARLAHRHGVRVQLRPHGSGGLTAMVLIPEALLGMPSPAYAGMPTGAREEAYPTPPPLPVATYQMGPGHPSYPSNPPGAAGAWPSPDPPGAAGAWPSPPPRPAETGRSSEQRAGVGSYDTGDIWTPSRTPVGWSGDNGMPKWPTGDQPPSRSFGDRMDGAERSRYDFPETESAATGPIPAVKPTSAGDEYLPIYASIESAWFEHGESGANWSSAKADAGWHAAAAVVEPVRDGATAAGLPKRMPKANLVPGSADTASAPKDVTPAPPLSPDRARNRLASFQKGLRAAREDISQGRAPSTGPVNMERPMNREQSA
ncbi:hypothetical protein AB0L53_47650, partial [Nonomuraea sp. NPDC052129]